MAAVLPSAHNVFVKSMDASNKLVVDYARNVNSFAVNRYCQIIPVKKIAGYYMEMTIEEAGRILHTDGRNFLWYDGEPAPDNVEGTEKFEFKDFRCERYAYGVPLGDLTVEGADWDILAQYASIKARQAMTMRTQLVVNALFTNTNFDSTHRLDATTISGNTGKWSESTTARQDIKRSLEVAAELILDDTLAAVDVADLVLVMSSSLAKAISLSQEIVDYIKGSPEALAQIRGELPGSNTIYGLPDKLYGFKLVVDPTRKVTSKKGGTTVRAQVVTSTAAVLCARPGSLVGVAGAPNFSTVALFAQEEMTVETKRDDDNRRVKCRVVDTVAAKVIAPASGVYIASCQ